MPRKQLPAIKLGYAIEEFFAHLEPTGLSKSSLTQKRRALAMLTKWAAKGEHTLTRNLTEEAFTDALRDARAGASEAENHARVRAGKGKRTGVRTQMGLNAYRGTFRQFADYCKWRKWVRPDFEPLYAITHTHRNTADNPREQRQLRIIPFADWPKLIDAAAHPRDRMMLVAGLYWARRPGELAEIKWGDIMRTRTVDGVTGWVQLFNLKSGERHNDGEPMPMGPYVRPEYDRYAAWYREHVGEPLAQDYFLPAKFASHEHADINAHDPVARAAWPLDPSRPMSVGSIGSVVKKALTAAFGWTGSELHGEGGHTLRRAGAVWTEEHGGLAVAQALMGHKHANTTLGYTKNAAGRKRLAEFMDPKGDTPPTLEGTSNAMPEPAAEVIDMRTRLRIA